MTTKQYFTGHGVLGVIFTFVGPIMTLIGVYLLSASRNLQYGQSPELAHILLIGVGLLMTIAALPLMLIGREYVSRD